MCGILICFQSLKRVRPMDFQTAVHRGVSTRVFIPVIGEKVIKTINVVTAPRNSKLDRH